MSVSMVEHPQKGQFSATSSLTAGAAFLYAGLLSRNPGFVLCTCCHGKGTRRDLAGQDFVRIQAQDMLCCSDTRLPGAFTVATEVAINHCCASK